MAWIAAIVLSAVMASAIAAPTPSCSSAVGAAPTTLKLTLTVRGTQPRVSRFEVRTAHSYLVEVSESGNDALVEVIDAAGQLVARADHPERRTGTRRAIVTSMNGEPLLIRITGKEYATLVGTATVRVVDLASLANRSECIQVLNILSRADTDYAEGEEIARDLSSTSRPGEARTAFLKAVDEYAAAQTALPSPGDQVLRGEAALAVAAAEYSALQDWYKAAEASQKAVDLFGDHDPYRRARAQAMAAASIMEIALQTPAGQTAPGFGIGSRQLMARARESMRALRRYHLDRHERYDAGLQQTNIGLTYFLEGRYRECINESERAAALFGPLGEIQRRAQAWQNRALCFWGLGHLRDALSTFKRVLKDIGPDPYPKIYLAAVNNTALLNYATGNFDEALRLFDRALTFGAQVQAERDEAQTLYGIGATYYALGDQDQARQFLERSLAIRTVVLDARGRMVTLRALATVEADQGKLEQAIAADRQALALANNPWASARITIQLAIHMAAAGNRNAAQKLLDDLLGHGATADPLIRAQALVARAVSYREAGRLAEALSDLDEARPALQDSSSVSDEWQADLERVRTLRAMGRTEDALAAVDSALDKSDAIRLQTANPELRAQLQAPLRPAFDLKLDLLWARFDHANQTGQQDEAVRLALLSFWTADKSRAHSLADVAAQSYSPDVRRALADDFVRRESLYREIAARRFALEGRLDHSGSDDAGARAILLDIAGLRRELDGVNTLIARRAVPQLNRALSAGMSSGLPRLPVDSALVAYWLGTDSAYAWVVSPAGIHWTRLPSPGAITEAIRVLHQSLIRFVDLSVERRRGDAEKLYDLVLQPIAPWLESARQWVVIPDRTLSFVPFSALKSRGAKDGSYVIADHDIVLTPAAWMMRWGEEPAPHRDRRALLLVADPVYEASDPRLSTHQRSIPQPDPPRSATAVALPAYHRLPFSSIEAMQIEDQFPSAEVDTLIGLDATRDRLLSFDWSKYHFVHIAAHGIVDAKIPALSALVMNTVDSNGRRIDGAVRVADLAIRSLSADVVVFSACDTAVGKEVVSEGLVGLSYTTLARGARAVVASLWPVADEISAQLMTDFYRHMLRDSMSPAAALGSSMRSIIARDPAADPALWAPYQVSAVALDGQEHARRRVTGESQ